MVDKYEKLVSDHWSNKAKKDALSHWTDSRIVIEHFNKCISGNAKVGWLQYVCEKYLIKGSSGIKYGLSIGCGSGSLERQCRKMGACETIDAIDIAGGAVEEAKKLAEEEKITGINYQVRNIEKISLPPNKYDVVFGSSAIHHIRNLERLFENVKASLKPNGLFIITEYVGPSQFQFSQKVIYIINEILQILPSSYKKLTSNPNETKESFARVSLDYMNTHDPSESIRSQEIVPILSKYFTIIERKDYGGTILHMLLHDIIENFNHDDEKDRTILKLFVLLETMLIREKVLESDFTFLVAKNNTFTKVE